MESSRGFKLLILLLASVLNTFLFLVGGSGALRDVKVIVPRYVRRGEDVRLTCNYNLERDQMYAVNWYRAGERKKPQEFYRYVPKEAPPQKAFQLPGFQVDVRRSSDHDVYLRNASLEISGLYKCSVTAEQTFETLNDFGELTVVVIGEDSPSVHLDRAQYHPGDQVTVECQSPYSYPPANITWFYNETEVGPSSSLAGGGEHHHVTKTEYVKSSTDPVTQSTLSRYSFDLPIPDKFPQAGNTAAVTIKCRVTLFTLYDQNSTIQTIAPIPRQLTGTDTLLRQGSSSSSLPSSSFSSALHHFLRFLLLLLLTSYMTTPNTHTTVRKAGRESLRMFSPQKSSSLGSPPKQRVYPAFSLLSLSCPVAFLSSFTKWLLCPTVLRSLSYPFYYLNHNTNNNKDADHHHHNHHHPHHYIITQLSPPPKVSASSSSTSSGESGW